MSELTLEKEGRGQRAEGRRLQDKFGFWTKNSHFIKWLARV